MLYIVCLHHCMYVCYMFIKFNQSINQLRRRCRSTALRDADAAARGGQVRAATADRQAARSARLAPRLSALQRRRTATVSAGRRQRTRRPRVPARSSASASSSGTRRCFPHPRCVGLVISVVSVTLCVCVSVCHCQCQCQSIIFSVA